MIIKRIAASLAVAAFILIAAQAIAMARRGQMIDEEMARRSMQVIIGLVLALYGNSMPKETSRSGASARTIARSQSMLRVGGWSMTLAGLGYAALWAFAPLALADVASMAVVASATLIMLGYAGWTIVSCRLTANRRST